VIEPRVFDHTAIIALFDGNNPAFGLWQQADQDELTIIMPAAAVAEANNVLGGTGNTWHAILDPIRVVVTPLDQSTAIDTGLGAGTLAVRHVIHEAKHTRGAIVTRSPWQYPTDGPPVRVI
jgi:hypothetical protein